MATFRKPAEGQRVLSGVGAVFIGLRWVVVTVCRIS